MGLFDRLKGGLSKTRSGIADSVGAVFASHEKITDEFYDDLEETMVMADMGAYTADAIIEDIKDEVYESGIKTTDKCRKILKKGIKKQLAVAKTEYEFEKKKSVVLVIGVNGTGKTTTVGKLAARYKAQGKNVLMAAADTFRAAAAEQLMKWSERAGVPVVTGSEGADPASVVYDAIVSARAKNTDILIVDTAGRLHNKKNLMAELNKIYRILEREYADACLETLLVLDGTTGQNAMVQAKEFSECAKINGLVITKLDGTSRGGIAVAVQSELGIPIKFIGVGEQVDDLQKFDPDAFVDALFAEIDED